MFTGEQNVAWEAIQASFLDLRNAVKEDGSGITQGDTAEIEQRIEELRDALDEFEETLL